MTGYIIRDRLSIQFSSRPPNLGGLFCIKCSVFSTQFSFGYWQLAISCRELLNTENWLLIVSLTCSFCECTILACLLDELEVLVGLEVSVMT